MFPVGYTPDVKVKICFIGKPRDRHAHAIAQEFVKRTTRWADCELREIDPRRYDLPARHATAVKVFLDPEGRLMTSPEFGKFLHKAELGAREVVFLTGGAEGWPAAWRPGADLLLSLSPMTFPHELARAMLAEQVYRAFATLRGHPYPR